MWEPGDGEEQLDELLGAQKGVDPIVRSVVGATLRFLTGLEFDAVAQELLARATQRFTNHLRVKDITDVNQWG